MFEAPAVMGQIQLWGVIPNRGGARESAISTTRISSNYGHIVHALTRPARSPSPSREQRFTGRLHACGGTLSCYDEFVAQLLGKVRGFMYLWQAASEERFHRRAATTSSRH